MTLSLATGVAFSVVAGNEGYVDFGHAAAQVSDTGKTAAIQTTDSTPEATPGSNLANDPAVAVVNKVNKAVVTVINEQKVSAQNGTSDVQPVGSGTGFIIDTDGHIVTNWHVVTGGTKFVVIFSDGSSHDATLVGSDSVSDIQLSRSTMTFPERSHSVIPMRSNRANRSWQWDPLSATSRTP